MNCFSLSNLIPIAFTDRQQALSGKLFTSIETFNQFLTANNKKQPVYVQLKGAKNVFIIDKSDKYQNNQVAFNKLQRMFLRIATTDLVSLSLFDVFDVPMLIGLDFELSLFGMNSFVDIVDNELENNIKQSFDGQIFCQGHQFIYRYKNVDILCEVKSQIATKDYYGILNEQTTIVFQTNDNKNIKLQSNQAKLVNVINPSFKFEDFGVGGLDQELADIFRKVFASRRFPPIILQKYGIKHAKGLLLFGPPGCGKTLIAKKLANVLNCVKPKIVNGPSILSEFIGKAEENIRNLFADAKKDEEEKGDQSPLHVIIFDEMDAICRKRGSNNSTSSEVGDKIVNQLLTMIDGPESLNNILVIGMTNMKELLDPAIIRAGRFEYHIEINLPDDKGRLEILKIHTKQMFKSETIEPEIDLNKIAKETTNFTGADLEQLVKVALSFAIGKTKDFFDFNKPIDTTSLPKVCFDDFQKAIQESKPVYGRDENSIIYNKVKLLDYGQQFQDIQQQIQKSIEYVKKQNVVHSILLEGQSGTGKTMLATQFVLKSDITFIKILTPGDFLGLSEYAKINLLITTFKMAYRSQCSCIVLDDLERIIEFINEGPRFSNSILQTLLILIKKIPDKEQCKLLIIGTTSQTKSLRRLELVDSFDIVLSLRNLNSQEANKIVEMFNLQDFEQQDDISIKRLLMLVGMKLKL